MLALMLTLSLATAGDWTEDSIKRHFEIPSDADVAIPEGAFTFSCRTPPGNSYDVCEGSVQSDKMYACRLAAAAVLFGAYRNDNTTFTYEIRCTNGYVSGEWQQGSKTGSLFQYRNGDQIFSKGIGF